MLVRFTSRATGDDVDRPGDQLPSAATENDIRITESEIVSSDYTEIWTTDCRLQATGRLAMSVHTSSGQTQFVKLDETGVGYVSESLTAGEIVVVV